MASTFRRKVNKDISEPSFVNLKGTKPWTGGITLSSTGLRDLDNLLGSGQPLGTCIWLEEDRWTQSLATCLVKYWCAEAISQEHHLWIPIDRDEDSFDLGESAWTDEQDPSIEYGVSRSEIKELLHSLPRNLHKDKQSAVLAATDDLTAPQLDTLEEGDEDDQAEAGLEIAWQYRKDVQRERLGHSKTGSTASRGASDNIFCHSFDLNGRLSDQMDVETYVEISTISCCEPKHTCTTSRACGMRYYRRLLDRLQSLLSSASRKVVRLLLYHPNVASLSVALPLLLTHIRTHQLPVVILIVAQPWRMASQQASSRLLQRMSDVVLETEGFASRREYPPPPEFCSLHGLLKIRKASTVTAATAHGGGHFADLTVSKRPAANLYGLKRDRRKLHIQLLHIPPEEYAGGGGSVGSGGVRSGAGRLSSKETSKTAGTVGCGSGGGTSQLDF